MKIGVIQSEILKFFSYPWCVLGVFISVILPNFLLCLAESSMIDSNGKIFSLLLQLFYIAQIGVIVVGANILGQDYTNHSLRSSLLAIPNRKKLLTMKLIMLTCTVFLSFLATVCTSYLLVVVKYHVPLDFLFKEKSILFVGMSWILLSWLSFALSILLKSSILPIAILSPFVLGLSQLLLAISSYAKFLPDLSMMNYFSLSSQSIFLDKDSGVFIQLLWVLLFGSLAFQRFIQRDVR